MKTTATAATPMVRIPLIGVQLYWPSRIAADVLPIVAIVMATLGAAFGGEIGFLFGIAMAAGVVGSEIGIHVTQGWRHLAAMALLSSITMAFAKAIIWLSVPAT